MRTRILALVAAVAACAGTALVVVPIAHADSPPFDTDWAICSDASDTNCIVSATANGVDTVPTQNNTVRDYPWVKQIDANLIDFGVWHDLGNGSTTNVVDPSVEYQLVVRTGTFVPREMNAVARDGSYSISRSVTTGYTFTVTFKPTPTHRTDAISCSYDGGCGGSTTAATDDLTGFATGDVQTLTTSGLSPAEISQRYGMATFTNAQNSYVFYNNDFDLLEVRLANPHLEADGVTPVTDGSYDAFLPDAFLIGTMNVPDPASVTKYSFTVTRTASGSTTVAPMSVVHEPGGVRIKLRNISFSRPKYSIKPHKMVPGKPRMAGVKKIVGGAKASFSAPVANGGAKIDFYRLACKKSGGSWHFKNGTKSPITMTGLPYGTVYCQIRAHNSVGYGPYGGLWKSHT
ncbi:hypothetical protein [Nocardioides marmorisolisilvae]|uniref:Fibronectin type III domain-containing protein n=1 Tax=Nocardioides marmorisolisilvae TaxID=1542737 RepID=A0A3N0DQI5_9ACTN|nr:hypothetical protein [Nocardioides marmorisolisilvae]RNL77726.1 hypothetical protein EFL95_17155 [Nocardioides marmorisolisilvae]